MRRLLFACLGPLVCAAAAAEPVSYQFDPTHSYANFEVLHFGTSTIRGRVGPARGDIVLDRAARSGQVRATIDTDSASTGVAPLDALLKRGDMLAVQAYPQAYFVGTQFEFDADGQAVLSVRGEFTLRGTGIALTLRALRFRCYLSPALQREVCGGDFEGEFLRSAFGITHSLPFVADRVRLLVQIEAIRQQ
jgi:polyisoprenoid-binding protein YceI